MELEILSSKVHFSRSGDAETQLSLDLRAFPSNSTRIDLGRDHIFCASRYWAIHGKGRSMVEALVTITANPRIGENYRAAMHGHPALNQLTGVASFNKNNRHYPEPHLSFTLFVEPEVLQEAIQLKGVGTGSSKLVLGIEDLEFGSDPDGSHIIWPSDDGKDASDQCLPITFFQFTIEKDWASEGQLLEEQNRRDQLTLADSPDVADRNFADILQAESRLKEATTDRQLAILRQCRLLLIALLIVGIYLSFG